MYTVHKKISQAQSSSARLASQLMVACALARYAVEFHSFHSLRLASPVTGAAIDTSCDNAPPHRASCVRDFKASAGIRSIPWPSRSPDLNPIEHVWDMLGRKLRSSPTQPNTLSQLADRLKTTWNEMLQDDVTNLIASMPRRIRAVIDARGGQTRY